MSSHESNARPSMAQLGWDQGFRRDFTEYEQEDLVAARVSRVDRSHYGLLAERGEYLGSVSGRFRHIAAGRDAFPAVGDWAAVEPLPGESRAVIHGLLPRRSALSRKAAGQETEEQVVAANVDTIFLVSGLDGDLNLRRIERYVTFAWESGAVPVVVLNKVDLWEDPSEAVHMAESVAMGVPVHAVSAERGDGLEALAEHVSPGKTVAFVGSSGVGKSSLVNRLLGVERQLVKAVRSDDSRGRHTTTARELFVLPGGGILVDTPGMRELQLWADEEDLQRTFPEIEALTEQCKFRDCNHEHEPGCAVRAAVEQGRLDPGRLRSYHKLQRELEYLQNRQEGRVRQAERERWKKIITNAKQQKKIEGDLLR